MNEGCRVYGYLEVNKVLYVSIREWNSGTRVF